MENKVNITFKCPDCLERRLVVYNLGVQEEKEGFSSLQCAFGSLVDGDRVSDVCGACEESSHDMDDYYECNSMLRGME